MSKASEKALKNAEARLAKVTRWRTFAKLEEALKRHLFSRMNNDLKRQIKADLKLKAGIKAKVRFCGCVVVVEIGNDIITISNRM